LRRPSSALDLASVPARSSLASTPELARRGAGISPVMPPRALPPRHQDLASIQPRSSPTLTLGSPQPTRGSSSWWRQMVRSTRGAGDGDQVAAAFSTSTPTCSFHGYTPRA
jgi:hypothetical protein